MGDNDPITGAMLFSITQLLRGVDWPVEPGRQVQGGHDGRQAGRDLHGGHEPLLGRHIMEVLSCLQYGWSWHEIVYKRRVGPWQKDGQAPLQVHRRAVRLAQDADPRPGDAAALGLRRDGDVAAMVQLAAAGLPDPGAADPAQPAVPVRAHKNNPEGRSILRNSYRPWYYKKRLEEFESVGVERDLAGLPMVTVPSDYLRGQGHRAGQDGRGHAQDGPLGAPQRAGGHRLPGRLRPGHQAAAVQVRAAGSGGARQHDTNALIQRYEQRQLMTILADFIMVGHHSSPAPTTCTSTRPASSARP
jgi:hypothetical protein